MCHRDVTQFVRSVIGRVFTIKIEAGRLGAFLAYGRMSMKHSMEPMDRSPKLLIIDENPIRSAIIRDGLQEAGFTDVVWLDTTERLVERIVTFDPDVIVIDLANPQRDTLEQMFQVSRIVRRPITMFVDQSDIEQTRAAIEAGVSAYIVDGLKKERVSHIIDMCILRFHAFARLEEELADARNALDDRKIIDQAKLLIMQARGLEEAEAYGMMRKSAMNQKKRIVDIARAIITASELMG